MLGTGPADEGGAGFQEATTFGIIHSTTGRKTAKGKS